MAGHPREFQECSYGGAARLLGKSRILNPDLKLFMMSARIDEQLKTQFQEFGLPFEDKVKGMMFDVEDHWMDLMHLEPRW
jgi:hypothetical protein